MNEKELTSFKGVSFCHFFDNLTSECDTLKKRKGGSAVKALLDMLLYENVTDDLKASYLVHANEYLLRRDDMRMMVLKTIQAETTRHFPLTSLPKNPVSLEVANEGLIVKDEAGEDHLIHAEKHRSERMPLLFFQKKNILNSR